MSNDASSRHNSDSDDDNDDDDISLSLTFHPITQPEQVFSSLAEALEHDRTGPAQFDLISHLPPPDHEDFFELSITFINKCRLAVRNGSDLKAITYSDGNIVGGGGGGEEEENESVNYFKPVIDEDGFLISLEELNNLKRSGVTDPENNTPSSSSATDVKYLQDQIAALQSQLALASTKLIDFTTSSSNTPPKNSARPDNDSYYFASYSHPAIHEQMLRDEPRTLAYANATTPTLFRNKVVLDVGCGTGILSLLAARAGARRVYAVDDCDIVHTTRDIVKKNGYEEVITVMKGRAETMELSGCGDDVKVDVIVSEWMGYALFFENMLDSVIRTRERFMTAGGTMFPDAARVFLEGAHAPPESTSFWKADVYGFDMTDMIPYVSHKRNAGAADVEVVAAECVTTSRETVLSLDLNTCGANDTQIATRFRLSSKGGVVDRFVVSFDVGFPGAEGVVLGTGCGDKETHWKQTVIWVCEDQKGLAGIELKEGEVLEGTFEMKRGVENSRELEFVIFWELRGKDGCIRSCLKA
eukprot:CAMPEP_0172500586 /NCGR_PEP_ID=MMETSP1066-20121228/140440_1 /TAXON_ID=671091 /ORGANISM="Coscinodiscus wailesii, Strain CCMP2513" /LENGTH=527 /DNA_ID=CAMNT_0013274901 /DNA_START=36 /DNA_END=1619 /DNA_ORIENTATION=+